MKVAVHHLHLDTLLPILPILAGLTQWATIELATALVVANLGHGGPDGVVWYGSAATKCCLSAHPKKHCKLMYLLTKCEGSLDVQCHG